MPTLLAITEEDEPKKKNKSVLYILIGVGILILLLYIGWRVYKYKQDKEFHQMYQEYEERRIVGELT